MTTKINGTNTAASPAITGADTDTGLSFGTDTVNINTGGVTRATVDSSGALDVPTDFPIKVNGSEKLRIDSSGNVGIAATSLSNRFTIGDGDLKFFNSDAANNHRTTFIEFGNSSNRITSESNFGSDGSSNYTAGYKFGTKNYNGSAFETLTPFVIQANGNVGITKTNPGKVLEVSNTGKTNTSCCFMHADGSDNVRVMGLRSDRATGGTNAGMIEFFRSDGSKVGSIQSNGSSTSYNTSSDYRLKENVTLISDGITRLKTLKPSRFNFISDAETTVDGFLAHEVTAVPEAVTGTKDQVATADDVNDEIKEGDPIYQGIDQSKLVPLLTAALQEAIAKIEVLETKVAALEAG